jgi:hypothetical protein
MSVQIKIRRSTSTQWASSTRVLAQGELGLDTTLNKLKVGNGVLTWANLPFLQADLDVAELSQDAVAQAFTNGTHSNITVTYDDATNKISLATGPDVVTTDQDGKIPDAEIPSEITRNTLAQTLTNKTIGLGTGITSIAQYDNISGFFGQSNIAIYQAGLDRGGRISISAEGVISVVNSGIGYVSGIVTTSGGTRLIISVGGNTLSGTLSEFNAALTDGDFATESYVATAVSNLVNAAPSTLNTLNELASALGNDASFASTITTALGTKATIASPTFTGTVGGITKDMVGLANVDNTTDALKPISTAAQTALTSTLAVANSKLGLTEPSVDYYVSNDGSGGYLVNGVLNGAINFIKGKKYRIVVNAVGHPFWIQTIPGAYSLANVYSTGITNAGTADGSIIVELPQNSPDNLYYACEYHSSMRGPIAITSENVSTPRTIFASAYTLELADVSRTIVTTAASGDVTITIPTNASVNLPLGSTITLFQASPGRIVVSPASGVTLKSGGDFNAFRNRFSFTFITLYQYAANSWAIVGDLSA